ncbi:GNAT family N-acetyltransferase [Virgibacillus kekensis]|uniref:GNAT family N-acetyltransferase n=1 Tax=Virgibacillus kekensis TaxID=202261 RepID=A0ABV9DHR2_9BACI
MIYINTPRLTLRDWKSEDLAPFRHMNNDPEVMRYFPNTLTSQETNKFYEVIQQEIHDHGYGLYAVVTNDTNEFIGFIGFHRATFEADFNPCVEIGFRLKKEAWGKGFATEGARACLEYGFAELGFNKIYSFTAKINAPSQNVMKKIGLQFEREFNHPNVDPESKLYRHVLYKTER